jgi:hypothetical protein
MEVTASLDWYQATIEEYPGVICDALAAMPGVAEVERGRGRQNYRESVRLLTADGDTLATIQHGGENGAPNAYASGANAALFAKIVRENWPDAHRVTRLDSAVDVLADFDTMRAACLAIAIELKIKERSVVHNDRSVGDTTYLGASASRVQMRVYEKGKQLLGQGVEGADPRLVRFEAQLRPERAAKHTASYLSAEQAWGATSWLRRVAGDLLDMTPERVVMQHRLPSTFETARAAHLVQYGGLLRQLRARASSWEQVGADLGFALDGVVLSSD